MMPEFMWLIFVLPVISVMAYMMDNDGHGLTGNVLMRILRWDLVFTGFVLLEYYLLFA